jgi:RNA polymerase sigma factor (sigma-70 family)
MMTEETMTVAEYKTDAELVSRTLAGDRDAFNHIVSRYQILICSLAYSRIGHLGQSEDVAQETFITAWKHLRLLRQPDKLRGWLCGIVRNRTKKCLESEGRKPFHAAEPLEAVAELPASDVLPSEQTITREEEAILWRALQRLPELYREPLILYYREHQSIEHVAAELELSEDAVKQRLSRGRKLVQEEVESFVENALRKTAPTQTLSSAVLAALPLTGGTAATAGVGAAGKGTLATKGLLAACLLPFIGIFTGFGAQWLMFKGGRAGPGRLRLIMTWVVVIAFVVIGQNVVEIAGHHFNWSGPVYFAAMTGWWWFYATVLATWIIPMYWRVRANPRNAEMMQSVAPLNYAMVVAGTHIMMFWGFILLAWQAQDRLGSLTIAGLMIMLGVWNFFKTRDQNGVPIVAAYILQIASCSALTIAILNLRLDLWLAHSYGVTVAELHKAMPVWMIPTLTLVLLAWSVAVFTMTKPKTAGSNL